MVSPASNNFATSFSLPGLATNRANRATLYVNMFKTPSRICRACLPTWQATTEQKTDRSVYYADKKRERLHALLFAHQFQGRLTGHVGGVRLALDHGSCEGSFNQ